MILIPLLISCQQEEDPTQGYLEQMTAITEPEAVDMWEDFTKTTYYVSHKLVLNPEETLYYAPKKFQDGEDIYLNKQELFFIVSVESGVITTNKFREATAEELKLIFDKTREEQTDLDTYDYYLMIVVSRQSLSQDNYLYHLHEAGKPLTSDSITYESDELWSVGEFVIAIELDEEGNVYFTDLNVTTDMIVDQYQEQLGDKDEGN